MEQPNQEIGTRKDLVLYRLETARNDLRSARALLAIEDYKGANNRAYYSIFHAINAVHAVSGKAVSYTHLHTIVLGGGLDDEKKWKETGGNFFLPYGVISKVFRGKYLDELKSLWNDSKLKFHRCV